MKHTTKKHITSLDQLNENDKIRFVHNATGTEIEYDVSKIDRENKRITLNHEETTNGPRGQHLIERNTLTIGADKDDYIFSDDVTIWLISKNDRGAVNTADFGVNGSNMDRCESKSEHHVFEPVSTMNPFTNTVVKMPVLVIDNPAVLPVNFEGKYRLDLHDSWKRSLKNGPTDDASLYPIFYQGRVFGVTAIDDRRTVVVRVKLGPCHPVFESTHTYPEGKPYDTNLAISACVVKLTAALNYWSTMTTSLALCEPDILSMFDGDTASEVLTNIRESSKTIIRNALSEHFKCREVNDDSDAKEEDDDDDNSSTPRESDKTSAKTKPWWCAAW